MDDALPDLGPFPGPPLPTGAAMVLETAAGAHVLGAPTVDSDVDGAPDTVVLGGGPAGDLLVLATDLDGDHHADVVTAVDAAGRAASSTAGADGRFDVDPTDPTHGPTHDPTHDPLPGPAPGDRDGAWTGSLEGPPPPAPTIDPVTGTWTRDPGGP